MAERNFRPVSVNIQCREERNPPAELKLDNGLIQINVKRFPDNSELSIQEESKIGNLSLFCDNMSLIWRMFDKLQVNGDCSEDARKSISKYVADTAKRVIGGSADMKRFFVYVHLEVVTIEDNNDDGDERLSDDKDTDMESEEEYTSDEEFTSGNNDMNTVVELSLDGYENKKVGASRSAIEGLKRERYSYGSGGDNPAKNSSDANACVICMEKFEAGTVVRYMPCSHIFHEVCLVPWLQENNSCPLCRLEIQSCSHINLLFKFSVSAAHKL
ncbi:hypothetical protein C5167_050716 [Papaver somniferum]|uniref:RING-type domain-containing protein n=1 Tax=Papaver somniferum TaxID=3469 RepID=A0A4Y7KSA3_PAPSO|nr:probable E3 ubiquitin-protein ligase RHY1A [Papaver somniferum]RZC75240.1 hypothetical protein C5167_050716 [Papaver somniferum]